MMHWPQPGRRRRAGRQRAHPDCFQLGDSQLLVATALARQTPIVLRDYWMYAEFSYSALFMLFGGALLTIGFLKRSAFLRWQALILIAATIAKVFLVDMSELSRGLRVLSFIGLGVLLLVRELCVPARLAQPARPEGTGFMKILAALSLFLLAAPAPEIRYFHLSGPSCMPAQTSRPNLSGGGRGRLCPCLKPACGPAALSGRYGNALRRAF